MADRPAPPPESTAALITGGAGGLGQAVGRALEAEGYRIVLLVRDEETACSSISGFRRPPMLLAADVTERTAVEAAVARATSEVGPPLVLINAAGIAESSALLPPDDELWQRTMAVNAHGAWITSTACLPAMLEARWGFICNVASTAALEGYRYTAAYVASKHALLGLTRAMACDLEGRGVRVAAVCPGFLDTPMTDRTIANLCAKTGLEKSAAHGALAAMNRSGALIDPADVARAILSLLRGETATDEALRID